MDLEYRVARMVHRAHTAERVLHDKGPWSVEWRDMTVPATREIRQGAVAFSFSLPEVCYLTDPEGMIFLRSGEEIVTSRPLALPGDGGHEITWEFSLTPVRAAS